MSKTFADLAGLRMSGCLFHFAQSLFRFLQGLPNLYALFRGDDQVKEKFKCFVSLAFVEPGQMLYDYFCRLLQEFEHDAEIERNCNYFQHLNYCQY